MLAAPLRTTPVMEDGGVVLLKAGNDLIIAGYASVELVDKQGDLITRMALRDAFDEFMKAEPYRNVQLAHSNIQVGEVIPSYTDNDGRMWKSTVDDSGMFVVIRLRGDIEKAREVANEIRKGNLKGFSIGGQAFKRINKHDEEHGAYTEISKLELHEVTICEKGINPEATFRILKEDTEMTENDDALSELSTVLDRLNKRLDDMEKGGDDDFPFPPKKKTDSDDDNGDDSDDDNGDDDDSYDDKKKEDTDMEKNDNEYSDVITGEYLNWMENTLKGAGVDIEGARVHFDDVEKAQLGGFDNPSSVDGADYFAGQVKGRVQEGGNPSTGAVGKLNSGKVKKSDFLNPSNLTPAEVEAAYEVYKAAATEQQFKESLNTVFSDRLQKEQGQEHEAREAANFDARVPLDEVQKAVESLGERIDNLRDSEPIGGEPVLKSGSMTTVEIPSSEDLGNMDWEDVHQLADTVWQ